MKNGGILRKIVSLVILSILICSIPVFASNVQSNANRQENRLVSTIGQTDDVVATTYEAATTNAKLNSLNGSFEAIQKNVDYLINNCFSKLTVWIDSTNITYASKTVTMLKGSTTVGSCTMKANGTHYEAVFEKLPDGTYTVKYPYILSNGTVQSITTSITIQGKDVSKRLYGDLFQMSIPEIRQACKDGTIHEFAHVGDTISDGKYTYTIIGINQDKPSDENGNLLAKSSYGDVLTLMPLGAPVGSCNGNPVADNMQNTPSKYGFLNVSPGYLDSDNGMKDYLNLLSADTKNSIGYVQKITGNNYGGENTIRALGEKLFLLSEKEIFGKCVFSMQIEANANFQYQYFSSIATSSESRSFKIDKSLDDDYRNFWWLRGRGEEDTYYVTAAANGYPTQIWCSNKLNCYPVFCIY